ncbi:hypothetical protein BDN70DRAFT_813400 [Pholiota conissans]|uniref:Uncharacterized protein n=1 Tax=Pholiota conissans TaxID=109636 RepID=A0A9P5YVE6_9AGAR|nr:hypothetical protein BDN70DRAFT_813400 [Pholiota conissans]
MSDLDADLYGDLYGNDEGETEVPQEEIETNQSTEPVPSEIPSVKAETPEETKPAQTAVDKSFSAPTPAAAPATNGSAIPTYTQQAPQQIPTYEQPLPNEYRDSVPPRTDGGYSNIPINERSVRPSEMKDEG